MSDPRCGHFHVREIVHVQETPIRYEYRCVMCEADLIVDPDEFAECQAGEREGFTATEIDAGESATARRAVNSAEKAEK